MTTPLDQFRALLAQSATALGPEPTPAAIAQRLEDCRDNEDIDLIVSELTPLPRGFRVIIRPATKFRAAWITDLASIEDALRLAARTGGQVFVEARP